MTNVINLYKRLKSGYDTTRHSNVEFNGIIRVELNNSINKGVILKRYGYLNKGERWKIEDLNKFWQELGYWIGYDMINKHQYVTEDEAYKDVIISLGKYRCNIENHYILPFGEILEVKSIMTINDIEYCYIEGIGPLIPSLELEHILIKEPKEI